MFGGGAGITVNEYGIYDYHTTTYVTTTGKTSESAPAQAGTGVFICIGQSLMGNHGSSNYDPNSANVLQLNLNADGVYRCKDPVLGATGTVGGLVSRLGERIVSDGIFTRVLMVPGAIGGSSVGQWQSYGHFHHRLRVAILRVRRLGLTPTAILWEQGQGNNGSAAQTWKDGVRELIDDAIGLQCTAPWFIAKCTMLSNVVDTTIQGAQTDLWNTTWNGVNIYAGPDVDSLTGGTNRSDGTHLTDVGNAAAAALWSTAINNVF
jgi:hypothetical protein